MDARQDCEALLKRARDGEHRRCRLLLCALSRLADVHPSLIDAAENFADGNLPVGEFTAAFRQSMPSWGPEMDFLGLRLGSSRLDASWLDVLWAARQRKVTESTFLWLAHDLVLDWQGIPVWRPSRQARDVARAVYEERRPDGSLDPARLAILADCLEEDGCPQEEVILHLRGHRARVCPSCRGAGKLRPPLLPLPVAGGCGGAASTPFLSHRPCRRCEGIGRVTTALTVVSSQGVTLPAPHYRGCWAVDTVLVQ